MSVSKKIEKLLVKRDGISRNEAQNLIEECKEEIELAIATGNIDKVDDILRDYLSLEPDFLQYIIDI